MRVTAYSFLYACGALASLLVAERLLSHKAVTPFRIRLLALIVLSTSVGGAHLFMWVLEFTRLPGLKSAGGSSMFGGIVFGLAALPLAARVLKIPLSLCYDSLAVAAPLGFGIGKIGCLTAGCCYGSFLGVPVQLASACADELIFVLLLMAFRAHGFDGRHAPRLLVLYGLKRIIEGVFRRDASEAVLGIDVFQWLGIAFVVIGAVFLSWHADKRWRRESSGAPSVAVPPGRNSPR